MSIKDKTPIAQRCTKLLDDSTYSQTTDREPLIVSEGTIGNSKGPKISSMSLVPQPRIKANFAAKATVLKKPLCTAATCHQIVFTDDSEE